MEEPGSRSAEAAGLRIDAVEVLPTDLRAVLLRVAGGWEGPRPERLAAPVLVLREPERRHRIDCLPETSGAAARAAPETRPFRAAFSVPDALAPLLEESIELDLGPLTVRLPAPAPPGAEADPAETEGTLVDPAVLAARRARRAELAEDADLHGAGEQVAGQLEGELGKLELRLAAAAQERADLEARLAAMRRRADEAERTAPDLEARSRELQERAAAVARTQQETTTARAELDGRVAALELRERELSERLDAERRARRAAEAELETGGARIGELERALADQDEHAAEQTVALARLEHRLEELGTEVRRARAAAERPAPHPALITIEGTLAELRTALERTSGDFQAALEAERGRTRAAQARADAAAKRQARAERRLRTAGSPWLEDALRRLARADRTAAARLALQLLPGQAIAVSRPLHYDIDVVGLGRHRIAVRPGSAEPAATAARWRRGLFGFRIVATPAGLVKLVIGGGAARPAGVRAARTLRRRRALRRLPAVPLRPAALARAGVLPDPSLLYRALAQAIDPEWTRGHRFTIALEIAGPRGGTWHVRAADGAPLAG